LNTLPNITRVIKLRMRWVGHVACTFSLENLKGRDYWQDLGLDRR